MICLHKDIGLAPQLLVNRYNDYLNFVGEKHLATCSVRGWDYSAAIEKADLQDSYTILDIGCATSYILLYLSQFVQWSYGIDDIPNGRFSKFTIPWLETLADFENYRNGKVKILNQNAAVLPFPDNFFDVVFTISALEHFKDEDDTLCVKEINRVLKVGGSFIGTVDYNPITEYPIKEDSTVRAYTYKAFSRRLLNPSKLQLKGKDFVKDDPVPAKYDKIVEDMFFHLYKS